jgi:hypothetical protein
MPQSIINPALNGLTGGSHGIPARVYFRVKPLIPQRLRYFIRRMRVPGILKRNADFWPIDPFAGQAPADWTGWPDGKKFALVFTHDVESGEGQAKTKQLAELEMAQGFRSSFNFIPEGRYKDSAYLREWLVDHGFEVGVHDLNHDGFLYESREGFSNKAESINRHLFKWGAVGFRSGFMLRRLDWLHDLNILYDTSTFDTDPFEPQPEGSRTIFPFHVQPPAGVEGPGYIELSYSLPQDSTLFLLLKEKTPAIWKQKLDWVARHGGLALVNIHPDYIDFSGNEATSSSYPVAMLREFMDYVRLKHGETFWNPLPRDLARWFRAQSLAGASSHDSPSILPFS